MFAEDEYMLTMDISQGSQSVSFAAQASMAAGTASWSNVYICLPSSSSQNAASGDLKLFSTTRFIPDDNIPYDVTGIDSNEDETEYQSCQVKYIRNNNNYMKTNKITFFEHDIKYVLYIFSMMNLQQIPLILRLEM